MQLLKLAILLHASVGIMMLANNDIFPSQDGHTDHFYFYL